MTELSSRQQATDSKNRSKLLGFISSSTPATAKTNLKTRDADIFMSLK